MLRHPSLTLIFDTTWDVAAKVGYGKIITEAHVSVFSSDIRTMRQLNELKHLMSLLWVSTSDVIVISTRHEDGRVTTIFSPSFMSLVGVAGSEGGKMSKALVIEVEDMDDSESKAVARSAFYVGESNRKKSAAA